MPNNDLISRKALLENYDLKNATKYGNKTEEQRHNSYSTLMRYEIADMIMDAPSVDAVEVVRHGEWITIWEDCYVGKSKAKIGHTFCSVCNSWRVDVEFKYCPNCGAKMENPT